MKTNDNKDINYTKETEALFRELKENTTDIQKFLRRNASEVNQITCAQYLNLLIKQKHLNKADIVANSEISPTYAYHVLGDRKKPTRLKVLALTISMGLNLEETQQALKYANEGTLYPRNSWDSIIIYAIQHKMNVIETDSLLSDLDQDVLLSNPK